MIYDDISQTIGRTPVVRIHRLAPTHVELYVKLEAANPGGSVKDRLALGILEDAERRGELKPGQTVVEATSGNTGIALALVCAARGYPFVAIMPESFSVERRQIMRAYGAKVVLTPAAERASGAVRLAAKLAVILRALYYLLLALFITPLYRDGTGIFRHLRGLTRAGHDGVGIHLTRVHILRLR